MTNPPIGAATDMQQHDRVERMCVDKGLRMTEQRRLIARVLASSSDHPDIETLFKRALAFDSRLSMATVYRTMRLFDEAGVVERHEFESGRSRYEEASGDHHDHLIDARTGRVIEFFNEEIERLKHQIAEQHGYRLLSHRLELYGVAISTDNRT